MPLKDIAGKRFGWLTAIKRHGTDRRGVVMWECSCDCGGTSIVRGTKLRNGTVMSCGGKGRSCRRFLRADMTRMVLGRLTVLRRNGYSTFKKQRNARWDCRCQCGVEVNVLGSSLRQGCTRSCGCLARERRAAANTTHAMYGTNEYRMWWSAKRRAKKSGLPFDLQLGDMLIPATCPLLGIALAAGKGRLCNSSPSLDRIEPHRGYVKDNVWVISQKANRMKSDLTLDQLKRFVAVLEARAGAR